MVRVSFCGGSIYRAVIAAGALAVATSASMYAHRSASALSAVFQARVRISVGSEFLLSQHLSFDTVVPTTIRVPAVRKIAILPVPMETAKTLSAVEKATSGQPPNVEEPFSAVERETAKDLARRFKALSQREPEALREYEAENENSEVFLAEYEAEDEAAEPGAEDKVALTATNVATQPVVEVADGTPVPEPAAAKASPAVDSHVGMVDIHAVMTGAQSSNVEAASTLPRIRPYHLKHSNRATAKQVDSQEPVDIQKYVGTGAPAIGAAEPPSPTESAAIVKNADMQHEADAALNIHSPMDIQVTPAVKPVTDLLAYNDAIERELAPKTSSELLPQNGSKTDAPSNLGGVGLLPTIPGSPQGAFPLFYGKPDAPNTVKAPTSSSAMKPIEITDAQLLAAAKALSKQNVVRFANAGESGATVLRAETKLDSMEAKKTVEHARALRTIMPSQQKARLGFAGQIVEAFTGGKTALSEVTVQVLGANVSAHTDANGNFYFKDLSIAGVLPIVAYKMGYLKRRIELHEGQFQVTELVAENAVAVTALAAGDSGRQDGGFVFGQLAAVGSESLEAMKVELLGPAPAEPIYLDTRGAPNKDLKMTSGRGQFIFLNLRPGTYLLSIMDAFGLERAPHLLHVGPSEGVVRKFSMGARQMINGKVSNTILNRPVDRARIQLLGSAKETFTGSDGRFTLGPVYVDCQDLNYLQIEKSGYYRNRVDYACGQDESANKDIFIFPAAYADGLSIEAQIQLRPATGIVVGHESFNSPVKMQLWGPDETTPGNSGRGMDFYLEEDGVLNAGRNRTTKTGNFVILDAPEGLSYVQAFNKDGWTLSYWPIYTSASTVNVYAQ